MGKTLDLGTRIEIHPLDRHCENISLGLYRRSVAGHPRYLVHTYAAGGKASQRVGDIREALITMAGLEPVTGDDEWLQFPCCQDHLRAVKRSFLDLCRLDAVTELAPRALSIFDKKAGQDITVAVLGGGKYQMLAAQESPTSSQRTRAIARGFAKLCEMDLADDAPDVVRFACGKNHDALMGLLLFRAQNVRAAMKEQELASGRGVLAPPSQQ